MKKMLNRTTLRQRLMMGMSLLKLILSNKAPKTILERALKIPLRPPVMDTSYIERKFCIYVKSVMPTLSSVFLVNANVF